MEKEKQEALIRLDAIEKESKELRKIIENAGKSKNIMERVIDLATAIIEIGNKDEEVLEYNKLVNAGIADHILAGQELVIISKALNEGKTPTTFYYPYFNLTKKPGSGFFFDGYGSWRVGGSVASARLTLLNKELALYQGKQFEQIHYRHKVKN